MLFEINTKLLPEEVVLHGLNYKGLPRSVSGYRQYFFDMFEREDRERGVPYMTPTSHLNPDYKINKESSPSLVGSEIRASKSNLEALLGSKTSDNEEIAEQEGIAEAVGVEEFESSPEIVSEIVPELPPKEVVEEFIPPEVLGETAGIGKGISGAEASKRAISGDEVDTEFETNSRLGTEEAEAISTIKKPVIRPTIKTSGRVKKHFHKDSLPKREKKAQAKPKQFAPPKDVGAMSDLDSLLEAFEVKKPVTVKRKTSGPRGKEVKRSKPVPSSRGVSSTPESSKSSGEDRVLSTNHRTLREFLKANPNCTIEETSKYFPMREINRQINQGRVFSSRGRLSI